MASGTVLGQGKGRTNDFRRWLLRSRDICKAHLNARGCHHTFGCGTLGLSVRLISIRFNPRQDKLFAAVNQCCACLLRNS